MIKEKEVVVKWTYQSRAHYESLGYEYSGNMKPFTVDVKHLTDGSNVKITPICDICGKEYHEQIKYQSYTKNMAKYGLYTCHQCSFAKVRLTSLERYGTEHPTQSVEVQVKRKNTNLQTYGVENLFDKNAPDEIKQKIKDTMVTKYGVENIFQDSRFIKQKCVEKWGVPHHFMLESEKEKYLYGSKNKAYNPNLTDVQRIEKRGMYEDRVWRQDVFERDNYVCQICGYDKGHILRAHHIFAYKAYPELRHDLNNGITMCKHCHKLFHDTYGYGENTQQQLNEFITNFKGQTTIPPGSTPEDELPVEVQNIREDDDIVYST